MENITAIIILYNQNPTIFLRLIESLKFQVNNIILVDNSTQTNAIQWIKEWLENQDQNKFHYINLGDNLGIATAQNIGIKLALQLQSEFVLLLDQDSVLPSTMVRNLWQVYQTLVSQNKKIATVGPIFLDEKTGEIAKLIRHKGLSVNKIMPNLTLDFEQADYLISSGSLINLKVFEKIGLMREDLFIDWVDIEWGLRARQLGYISYAIPKVIMKHSIGDEFVDFGEKKINLHTDFRNYFIVRNSVYLALYGKMPLNFSLIQLAKTPLYIIFYSYHSKQKLYSLGLLTRAVWDGLTKKMGKGYFQDKGL